MNEDSHQHIKELLDTLSLQEPSSQLDARVMRLLAGGSNTVPDSHPRSRRRRFAMTAASFALLGFGLGWWLSPAKDSPTVAQQMENSKPAKESVAATEPSHDLDSLTKPQQKVRPRLVDQGFVLHEGDQPVRKYRIEGAKLKGERASLKLREEILLPSEEI